MANQAAWSQGWQTGTRLAEDQRARKERLADEDRKIRVDDYFKQRDEIVKTLPNLTVGTPERDRAEAALNDIHTKVQQIYHPIQNPGALQKDWHWLSGHIRKSKATPAALSTTTEPGSPEQSISLPDQTPAITFPGSAVNVVRPPASGIGPEQSFQAITPASTLKIPPSSVTLPATAASKTATVKPTALSGQQRQTMGQRDTARAETALDVASAGLTPEQQGTATARSWRAEQEQKLDSILQIADRLGISKQDQESMKRTFLENAAGIAPKPVWKEYVGPNGEKKYLDASRPDSIEPGWNAAGTESADTRTRADFDVYKKQHPEYTGTLQQWKAEQSQLGKLAVPTNRDDRYIAIEQKKALLKPGETLSEDDQAYAAAYDLYVQKRIIDPAVARAAAQGANRYVQVMDLNDPEKVTFMRAGDAARAGAGSPQSIGFQIDKAVTRAFTTGNPATNINIFNTAVDHLKLLSETADALNNGDIQLLNSWGKAFATATGDPAPTDFATVKNAVAGEISKTFKGTAATEGEIALINQTINQAQSPEQLHGAIEYYLRLMGGKLGALKSQYEQGKQGKPAFAPTPATGGGGGGGRGGATPDEYVFAKSPSGKIKRAKKGTPLPPGWTLTNAPSQ